MRLDLSSWQPTLGTVHAYAKVVGTIRRNMVDPLPHWGHASVTVTESGLSTGPLPGGLELEIDHCDHRLVLRRGGSVIGSAPLDEGLTATELGDEVVTWLRGCGVDTVFDASRWRDDTPRSYAAAAAAAGHAAQLEAAEMFASLAARVYPWEVTPVALWPHHFDVAVAVIGTRRVRHGDDEGTSQIGCGFAPPDENVDVAYYYATPWPFPDELGYLELPGRAHWTSAGFQGAVVRYDEVDSSREVVAFFEAVLDEAAPLTLV